MRKERKHYKGEFPLHILLATFSFIPDKDISHLL